MLQVHQKWQNVEPNLAVNDMVLLYEKHEPRDEWPLGRIIQVYSNDQGKVRWALVSTDKGTYRRPITKLCKILPAVGGSASPASLGVEMITHFDAKTALRCCQMK